MLNGLGTKLNDKKGEIQAEVVCRLADIGKLSFKFMTDREDE